MKKFFLILTIFFCHFNLNAWGRVGHMAVGDIASIYLTEKTRIAVHQILKDSGFLSLKEIAPFSDYNRPLKTTFPWIKCDENGKNCKDFDIPWNKAGSFHFVSLGACFGIDSKLESEQQIKDCVKKIRTICEKNNPNDQSKCGYNAYTESLHAIKILSSNKGNDQKLPALIWLTHLIGDLSQPLHMGNIDDRGGNNIYVDYCLNPYNKGSCYSHYRTKLHSIWDEGIFLHNSVDAELLVSRAFTRFYDFFGYRSFREDVIKKLNNYRIFDLIKDTFEHLQFAYSHSQLPHDQVAFDEKRMATIEELIFKAGFTLANILNDIFDCKD